MSRNKINIEAILDSFDDDPADDRAGKGRRFANFMVDSILIIILYPVLLFIFAFLIILVTNDPDILDAPFYGDAWAGFCIIMLFAHPFLYYLLSEYYFEGRSPAKFITRTRAVTVEGKPASFNRLLGRTFARCIPLEVFTFLGGRGLHDSLSGTMVIKIVREDSPNHQSELSA